MNKDLINQIVKIFYLVLIGFGVIAAILFYGMEFSADEATNNSMRANLMLNYGIILFAIAVIAVIGAGLLFFVFSILDNPIRTAKKLIGPLLIVFIVLIASVIASDAPIKYTSDAEYTATAFKNVGTGIFTMYLMFFGAIGAIVVTEIVRVFR